MHLSKLSENSSWHLQRSPYFSFRSLTMTLKNCCKEVPIKQPNLREFKCNSSKLQEYNAGKTCRQPRKECVPRKQLISPRGNHIYFLRNPGFVLRGLFDLKLGFFCHQVLAHVSNLSGFAMLNHWSTRSFNVKINQKDSLYTKHGTEQVADLVPNSCILRKLYNLSFS